MKKIATVCLCTIGFILAGNSLAYSDRMPGCPALPNGSEMICPTIYGFDKNTKPKSYIELIKRTKKIPTYADEKTIRASLRNIPFQKISRSDIVIRDTNMNQYKAIAKIKNKRGSYIAFMPISAAADANEVNNDNIGLLFIDFKNIAENTSKK